MRGAGRCFDAGTLGIAGSLVAAFGLVTRGGATRNLLGVIARAPTLVLEPSVLVSSRDGRFGEERGDGFGDGFGEGF